MPIRSSTDRFNGVVASQAVKVPVIRAVASNVASLSGPITHDGHVFQDNDRILLWGQTDQVENGIYDVNPSSAWRRSADFDGNRDAVENTLVVADTSTEGPTLFRVASPAGAVTIGEDAIVFEIFSGAVQGSTGGFGGGNDQLQITIGGVLYESDFGVSTEGTTKRAQTILQRDSTTRFPLIIGARSNSEVDAEVIVTDDMDLLNIMGVGWDGDTDYEIGALIRFAVDGTPGTDDMPGKIVFLTSPDGSGVPLVSFHIDAEQNQVIENAKSIRWFDEGGVKVTGAVHQGVVPGVPGGGDPTTDPDIGSVTLLSTMEVETPNPPEQDVNLDIGFGIADYWRFTRSLGTAEQRYVSNAQSKFGKQSAFTKGLTGADQTYWGLSDSTDTLVDLNTWDGVNMAGGNFTLEVHVYVTVDNSDTPLLAAWDQISKNLFRWEITGSPNRKIRFAYSPNGSSQTTIFSAGGSSVPNNQWVHLALVRNGNDYLSFIDGVLDQTVTQAGSWVDPPNAGTNLNFGAWDSDVGLTEFYLDNLRVTKGVARYTTTFTPPNEPYDGSASVEALYVGDPTATYDTILQGNRVLSTADFLVTDGDNEVALLVDATDSALEISSAQPANISRLYLPNMNLALAEQAAAPASLAAAAQLWVRNDVPNALMLQDDAGNDFHVPKRQFKYKPDDELRNNTTAASDDEDFVNFSLLAGKYYKLECLWRATIGTTPDLKFQFAFTQVPALVGQKSIFTLNASAVGAHAITTINATADVILGAAGEQLIKIQGLFRAHATINSTVRLQWAQNVATVENTILHGASWMMVEQIEELT
jgi:hypothetical protein